VSGNAGMQAGDDGLLPAGRFYGGYQLEREIARGAMGALYLAVDPRTQSAVALKTLALAREFEGQDLDDARERFLREAGAATRLQHPDIVRVLGGGESAGLGYIVMELLPGCDLTRYTRPSRLLPEAVVLRIGARVADALAYAHRLGVVHRDVKPANVVVDMAGDQVKVTDFGLARLTDQGRTRSGLVLGTPSFMSPELLAGASADARSDLYALGVLLFQLLTGQLPYEGESLGRLLQQIATAPARDVRTLRPELPADLAALLARLLHKQPEGRPGDGFEVAGQLRHLATRFDAAPPACAPAAAGEARHNRSPS
jgi:serine/threonine-protein kinase